ncbi:helix-turn-helix domain-containing protein, partial [Pseudomonas helleri]|uniref:helix-turn-helix domain-containing protein n=1 Tax=Pseudomonas helleri TaxID=1608996 RepID=UPI0012F8F70F
MTFPVRCCPYESYTELSVEERATIQISHAQGFSLRRIACLINRSPSTISRELR